MTLLLNLTRLFYALLLLLGIGGLWWLAPPDAPILAKIFMTIVVYGPILIFTHGVISGSPRLLTWLCFLLMFYFCGYVIQLFYPPPMGILAIFRVTTLVALFITAMLVIRAGRADLDR